MISTFYPCRPGKKQNTDRYLFQANIRHDGSSRFAKKHRWGTFPSFSAGWVLSEENFMKNLYCLFLDRDNMREGLKTILQAIDYVKNGISICIFPEGTRNNGEELSMLPFRDGALKIAEKTGCAIIPISMNNTADIFEAHFPDRKSVV